MDDNVKARTGLLALLVAAGLFAVVLVVVVTVGGRKAGPQAQAAKPAPVPAARAAAALPPLPKDDDGFDWNHAPRPEPAKEPNPPLDGAEIGRQERERQGKAVLKLPAKPAGRTAKDIVEAVIRRTVDDPDGLEFVEWGEARQIVTRVPGVGNDPVTALRVRFRTKNQYGAKQLLDGVFLLRDGRVVRAMSIKQFETLHNMPTFGEIFGGAKYLPQERGPDPVLDGTPPPIKPPF